MVESIDKVTEVDLVTNPATATSLREQAEMAVAEPPPTKEEAKADESDMHADNALESGVLAVLKNPDTSLEEKEAKIKELFAAHLSVHEGEEKAEEKSEAKAEEVKAEEQAASLTLEKSVENLAEQVKTLTADNTQVKAELAELKKKPRKYLGVGGAAGMAVAESIALAEQTQTDAYPDNGTPAEKAAWLRRRQ